MVTYCLEVFKYNDQFYVYLRDTNGDEAFMDSLLEVFQSEDRTEWLDKFISQYKELAATIDKFERSVELDQSLSLDPGLYLGPFSGQKNRTRDTVALLGNIPWTSPPVDTIGCREVYTIDLDQRLLSLNNFYFFRLDPLPLDWRCEIKPHSFRDMQSGSRLRESLQPLIKSGTPNLTPTASPIPSSFRFALVSPKQYHSLLDGLKSRFHFTYRLFKRWTQIENPSCRRRRNSSNFMHWNYIASLESGHLAVRETVFAILSLALGTREYLELYKVSGISCEISTKATVPLWDCIEDVKSAVITQSDPKILETGVSNVPRVELASRLALGYHDMRREANIAPKSTTYWFANTLICLRNELEHEEQVKPLIRNALQLQPETECYGLLISIQFVIAFQVVRGSQVKRTRLLKLVDLELPSVKNSKELAAEEIGFHTIARLLETSKIKRLQAYGVCRRLPREIVGLIVKEADQETRRRLSACSIDFHRESQRWLEFVDSISLRDHGLSCCLTDWESGEVLELEDGENNTDIESRTITKGESWIPVVGSVVSTRSILLQASFSFPGLTKLSKAARASLY